VEVMLFVSFFPLPRRFGANDDVIDDITECSLVAFFMAYMFFWRARALYLRTAKNVQGFKPKKVHKHIKR
jgi:hypothetical protein